MNPRVYLSGRFCTGTDIETKWLKRTGCKYRCFTFANANNITGQYSKTAMEALAVCEKAKIGIMMDSGAHTIHKLNAQSKRRNDKASVKQEIDLEAIQEEMFKRYVEYVKKNKSKWDFYITLDWKKDQKVIYDMQKRFVKEHLLPMPVYHGDSSLDWLRKHRDMGCKVICIGSDTDFRGSSFKGYRFYFDKVFDFGARHDIRFHGLAVTSLSMLTMYPWYSVDSSTWSKNAIYGLITFPDKDKNVIYNMHISDRFVGQPAIPSYNTFSRRHRDMVDETVRGMGFDVKEMRHGPEGGVARHEFNGYIFSHIFELIDSKKQAQKSVKWTPLL